jgi:phosphoglycolate phosphatase
VVLIWDFNGTLLDDMQVCIECMNIMLNERKLPLLDLARYREVFTFPVKDYYISLGFDFNREPFDVPAHQFIDHYREHLSEAPLQPETLPVLDDFKEKGIRQIVLSAMEQEFLEDTLRSKGIYGYFEQIAGIENHLGEGKLDMALRLISKIGVVKEEIIMVGDTEHDFEVAMGSGIRCILIARGHQSFERLRKLNCKVVADFEELKAELQV